MLLAATAVASGSSLAEPVEPSLGGVPHPFRSVAEYNSLDSKFYGQVRENGTDYLVAIGPDGRVDRLSELPDLGGWISGGAAMDPVARVIYLLTIVGERHVLTRVGLDRGKVLSTVALTQPIKQLVIDPHTSDVLGFFHQGESDWFARIDVQTGTVEAAVPVPRAGSVFDAIFVESERPEILVIGSTDNGDFGVFLLDAVSGKVRSIETQSVQAGESVVATLVPSQETALLTVGTQACTAVAGSDPASGVSFIAHYRPTQSGLKQDVEEFVDRVRDLTPGGALKGMSIAQIGGIRSDWESIRNMRAAYQALAGQPDVDASTIRRFNTGVSHNVVIYRGRLLVF